MSRHRFSNAHIIFLAAMVASDFAIGMVVKTVLAPTGILSVLRLDMAIPVMLMMLTRLMLDRFGTLVIYEGAWGVLATLAMPGAFGLPGPLKIVPALLQGLMYDGVCSGLRRFPRLRLYSAAAAGGLVSLGATLAIKVALGVPWANVTKVLFGINLLTSTAINLAGAALALLVWGRIHQLQVVKLLRARQ